MSVASRVVLPFRAEEGGPSAGGERWAFSVQKGVYGKWARNRWFVPTWEREDYLPLGISHSIPPAAAIVARRCTTLVRQTSAAR